MSIDPIRTVETYFSPNGFDVHVDAGAPALDTHFGAARPLAPLPPFVSSQDTFTLQAGPPGLPHLTEPLSILAVPDKRLGSNPDPFDTRPELARQHLAPKTSTALLNEDQLKAIASERYVDTARLRTFSNLGDADEQGRLTRNGIITWADLLHLMQISLEQAHDGMSLAFEIDAKEMDALYIPASILRQMNQLSGSHPDRNISLIVHGSQVVPPTVYRFSKSGVISSIQAPDNEAISFWNRTEITNAVAEYLEANPAQKNLYDALQAAHRDKNGRGTLGDFLTATILSMKQDEAGAIPLDQRTLIYDRLGELTQGIHKAAKAAVVSDESIPVAAFAWDPVTQLKHTYKRLSTPDNAALFDGLGQMASLAAFLRAKMDNGTLPLDMALIGASGSRSLLAEFNGPGTNERGLRGTPPNPRGQARVAGYHESLLDELLLTHLPEVIFINKKANAAIEHLSNPHLLDILRVFKPTLALPVKSLGEDGQLPFSQIYNLLKEISPELAERLSILAGFFAAPWILKGLLVDMIVASGSEISTRRLGRLMSLSPVDDTGRSTSPRLRLKLIASRAMAAVLNAGGAIKNFLTYRSARILHAAGMALSIEEASTANRLLALEKNQNIGRTEEITARLLPTLMGINTDHLWAPKALKADLKNCLPQNSEPLLTKANTFWEIIEAWNPENFKKYLQGFVDISLAGETRNDRDGRIDESIWNAYHVIRLAALIQSNVIERESEREKILNEWRNNPVYRELAKSRSDVMDLHTRLEIRLLQAAEKLAASSVSLETLSYNEFYDAYFPPAWKHNPAAGTSAQEGRNGIGHLVAFANRHNLTLHEAVYEAHELYRPGQPTYYRDEVRAANYTPPTVEALKKSVAEGGWGLATVTTDEADLAALNDQWGLPVDWVDSLSQLTQNSLARFSDSTNTPTQENLLETLTAFQNLLMPIRQQGGVPLVTDRLRIMTPFITELIRLLNTHTLNQDQLNALKNDLRVILTVTNAAFEEGKTTTAILNDLRIMCQTIHRTQQSLNKMLAKAKSTSSPNIDLSSLTTEAAEGKDQENSHGRSSPARQVGAVAPTTHRAAALAAARHHMPFRLTR